MQMRSASAPGGQQTDWAGQHTVTRGGTLAKGKRQKRQSMRDLPANPDALRLLELVDPEREAKPEPPAGEDEDANEDDAAGKPAR